MGLITSNSWKQKQSTSDQPLASGCEFHFCVETTFYRTAISIVCTILSLLPTESSLHPVLKPEVGIWISGIELINVNPKNLGPKIHISKHISDPHL